LGSHLREEGSLDYDEGFVRLQVHLKFNTNIYRQQVALYPFYRRKGEGQKGNSNKSDSPTPLGCLVARRRPSGCIEGRLDCVVVEAAMWSGGVVNPGHLAFPSSSFVLTRPT
jgi:hypothetical protein